MRYFVIRIGASRCKSSGVVVPSGSSDGALLGIGNKSGPIIVITALPVDQLESFRVTSCAIRIGGGRFGFAPPRFGCEGMRGGVQGRRL